MPYQIKNGIVYGSNAVSLTQAQYDALSTAEKNNGTVYYIYDVDDIYSGNVVKNVVLSASKWASDAYTITDPDITGANIVFLTYPSSISDEMYSAIQSANIRVTNQANGSITLQALGGAPSINLTITLIIQGVDLGLQTAEYVTYDNSTSGLEAVNVQEAVDELSNGLTQLGTYSTSEEIVVGTWTDGKPIYRRVLTGLNYGSTTGSWTNTGATIQNIDHLVKCEGWISATNIITMMGFRTNGTAVQYWAANSWGGTDTVIAEYTKTTD